MSLKTLVLASFSALALSGCGQTAVKTVCPPIINYDVPFLNKLADELDAAPDDSAMVRAVLDYRALRDMIRACGGR